MTGDTVSTASDIYSFGISLWEFITRQEAFSHHTTFAGLKASVVVAHERPVIPADCPASLAGLLVRCWAPDPSLRPDAATVVNELSALIEEEKIQLQWDKVVAAIPFDDGRHFWYYAFTDVRCECASESDQHGLVDVAADTVDVAARGAVVDLHRDAVHALATGAAAQLRRADARDIGDSLCQGARVRQRPRDGSQVRAVDWMFRAARWLVLASRTSSSRRVRCVALREFYHSLCIGADSMADVTSMVSWRLADAAGGELAPLTSTVSSRKRDGIT